MPASAIRPKLQRVTVALPARGRAARASRSTRPPQEVLVQLSRGQRRSLDLSVSATAHCSSWASIAHAALRGLAVWSSPACSRWRPGGISAGARSLAPVTARRRARQRCSALSLPDADGQRAGDRPVEGQGAGRQFLGDVVRAVPRGDAEFVKLQKEFGDRGVQFVGIAVDDADKVKAVRDGDRTQLSGADRRLRRDRAVEVAGQSRWALPFTVIVDRAGDQSHTQLGPIKTPSCEPSSVNCCKAQLFAATGRERGRLSAVADSSAGSRPSIEPRRRRSAGVRRAGRPAVRSAAESGSISTRRWTIAGICGNAPLHGLTSEATVARSHRWTTVGDLQDTRPARASNGEG